MYNKSCLLNQSYQNLKLVLLLMGSCVRTSWYVLGKPQLPILTKGQYESNYFSPCF